MSADNWGICPKCKRNAEEKQCKLKLKAGKAYGSVTPEEYLELLREADKPLELTETLREDYEMGTDDAGQFYVYYTCSCHVCKFKHEFKHAEQLLT